MVDRLERNKDIAQEILESTATRVGRIATIITTAVVDVAREVGDLISDGFEMREAAQRARLDAERTGELGADDEVPVDDHIDGEILDGIGERPALPGAREQRDLETEGDR
ncbi:hypothetical protein [Gordonia soli]|uniref:Uncharacterized protein n=1 Tax=Gordonia soli NBRC 108243 TaxID=1223545 RepID=M0QJ14_9ACTN|nr:hypothetical protein [Gordonia soli]GAC68553.1 hypothetical protein GS4_16_00830 [Gordonia soli NBRC 108243]